MRIGRFQTWIVPRIEIVYMPNTLTIEILGHWTELELVTNL